MVPFITLILYSMLCATVVFFLSCHRYCHVYCHPYVSSVRSHREPSSLSACAVRTTKSLLVVPVSTVQSFCYISNNGHNQPDQTFENLKCSRYSISCSVGYHRCSYCLRVHLYSRFRLGCRPEFECGPLALQLVRPHRPPGKDMKHVLDR